jgi:hypothetical protein
MSAGEEKTVTIPAAQAYGDHNPQAIQQVPREAVPADIPLDLGTQLQVQTQDGRALPVVVTEVTEEQVTARRQPPAGGQGPDLRGGGRQRRLTHRGPRSDPNPAILHGYPCGWTGTERACPCSTMMERSRFSWSAPRRSC